MDAANAVGALELQEAPAPPGDAPSQPSARAQETKGPFFRIGESSHAYEYYPTHFKVNEAPVYRCIRSSGNNVHKRLYLYKSSDERWAGTWIATEAHRESPDPVNSGEPVFKTAWPVDDISRPAHLVWEYWEKQGNTGTWQGNLAFTTYQIRPPP